MIAEGMVINLNCYGWTAGQPSTDDDQFDLRIGANSYDLECQQITTRETFTNIHELCEKISLRALPNTPPFRTRR